MLEIVELEQALMVCDWRLSTDYDDLRWSITVTTRAEENHRAVDRAGYLIS